MATRRDPSTSPVSTTNPQIWATAWKSTCRLPGVFLVDAASQFALESRHGTVVDGVGVKAACVDDLTTSPPTTTLLLLLSGDRLLRVIQGNGSCDTLKRFAQLAIGRIGAQLSAFLPEYDSGSIGI